MFKIFKRFFFLSILNIQVLNIVSSEPKEWTIHFNKFHHQNYFRKTYDPIFPLKKKKKKKKFEKGRKVRVYWRNKLRDLLKYQFQTIWYLNGCFFQFFYLGSKPIAV